MRSLVCCLISWIELVFEIATIDSVVGFIAMSAKHGSFRITFPLP